jgi:pSer/pThr/pTyr-binding forkhead associated (FHA) protein
MKKVEEHIPTSIFDTEADQEMQAEYGVQGSDQKPAFLYVERGPGAGQLLEVKQGSVVVGRASVSDLRLQHPSISRRHTQIKRVGEQFFVKDLGSQNGTFVNKQRIETEVEVKPGDSIAMGNALLRLRGPLAKGEKLPAAPLEAPLAPPERVSTKSRISTAVVARPSSPQPAPVAAPSNTALKIAVFAGAVGFSLAGVLAFALVKTMSPEKGTGTTVAAADKLDKSDKDKLIDEAIKRKMAEKPTAAPTKTTTHAEAAAAAAEDEVSDDGVTVKEQPKAPSVGVVRAPVFNTGPKVAAAAPKKAAKEEDDEGAAPAAKGGTKRTQILAPYEKGNAEASLEAAKKAGDKDLSDKLSRFIAAYDAANDAMMSNNGSAAIANFQKALSLDEGLSSGWGKYGAEIRHQLSNLYVLVGMQFVSNGDPDKAKVAFQASLKHDPNNARAKSQLAKLGAAPKDDEEEAAPVAKTPAPKKKAAPKSIDDAFGD